MRARQQYQAQRNQRDDSTLQADQPVFERQSRSNPAPTPAHSLAPESRSSMGYGPIKSARIIGKASARRKETGGHSGHRHHPGTFPRRARIT